MSTITKGPIGAQDFQNYDGVNATFSRLTSDGYTLTLQPVGTEVDVLMAYGGGVNYTAATITSALTAIGLTNKRTLVLRPGTWVIAANTDWSAYTNITFKFAAGAIVSHGAFTVNIPNVEAGYYPIFTGAGAVTVSSAVKEIYPEWFGAKGDGVTDDTTSLKATIAAAKAAGGGIIRLGNATYLFTSTLLIDAHRVSIEGIGDLVSTLLFAPTANDVAIELNLAGNANCIAYNQLRRFTLNTADTTYVKVGIKLVDAEETVIEDVHITDTTNGSWSDATVASIGLQTQGRQLLSLVRPTIFANIPISIENNPIFPAISADCYVFDTVYLVAHSTQPCVQVEDGCIVTNWTFMGSNSFCVGKYAIYWVDTTAATVSINVSLHNMKIEQASDVAGYAIYISHTAVNLWNLSIKNIMAGDLADWKGIYLRGCRSVVIENYDYFTAAPSTGVGIDVDNTVYPLVLINAYTQSPATESFGTLTKIFDMGQSSAASYGMRVYDVPGGATYDYWPTFSNLYVPGVFSHKAPIAFTEDDATPSVAGGNIFYTANANPTTITDLHGGTAGQVVKVIIWDAVTTIDFSGTNLFGNAGVDWTPAGGDWMECIQTGFGAGTWLCSVHDCSA